jgi:hypothetical protein
MKKEKPKTSYWNDKNWKYIPSVSTDVMARFKAMGWVPPSEKLHLSSTKGLP